jgi:hypothetical protein
MTAAKIARGQPPRKTCGPKNDHIEFGLHLISPRQFWGYSRSRAFGKKYDLGLTTPGFRTFAASQRAEGKWVTSA